jgi:formylmethanofuran dehydrogenase subunit A
VGADADVTIFPEQSDAAMFQAPRYVIKGGEIVLEEGAVRDVVEGREFVTRPGYEAEVETYLRPWFQQYYTMSFDNYPVEEDRVQGMQLTDCRPRS